MTSPTGSNANSPGYRPLEDPLLRFDARILDPSTAVRLVDGTPLRPTVYRNNRVLVTAGTVAELQDILDLIDRVLGEMYPVDSDGIAPPRYVRQFDDPRNPTAPSKIDDFVDERPADEWVAQAARLERAAAQNARNRERNLPPVPYTAVITFRPTAALTPLPPLDVVALVQRSRVPANGELGQRVGLEHLLFLNATLSPFGATLSPFGATLSPFGATLSPFGATLSPFGATLRAADGLYSYLAPGSGGRTPASIVLNLPTVDSVDGPRVVVLDTGCTTEHPWFEGKIRGTGEDVIERRVTVLDESKVERPIGIDVATEAASATDPEGRDGCAPEPMVGALKPAVGHGTFIAGILRQKAPGARITALRIADADGVVPEGLLVQAIDDLVAKQIQEAGWADAVVLSLGYYPESEQDRQETSALGAQLVALGQLGVAVFAAAGNDSTNRECFPAAFAHPRFAVGAADPPRVPLVSVAARNPDGTIALFSNDGEWVTADAPGVNVVSAFPTCLQGPWQPSVSLDPVAPTPLRRTTVDPDDYSGGFGLWSGTSFAAPVVAGEYVAELSASLRSARRVVVGGRPGQTDEISARTAVLEGLEYFRKP